MTTGEHSEPSQELEEFQSSMPQAALFSDLEVLPGGEGFCFSGMRILGALSMEPMPSGGPSASSTARSKTTACLQLSSRKATVSLRIFTGSSTHSPLNPRERILMRPTPWKRSRFVLNALTGSPAA